MVRDFAFGEAAAFFAFTADRVAARAAFSVLGATAAAAAPGLLGATTAAPAPGVKAAGHAMIWAQETQLCTNRLFRTRGVFPRHQIIRVGKNERLFRGVEPPAGPRLHCCPHHCQCGPKPKSECCCRESDVKGKGQSPLSMPLRLGAVAESPALDGTAVRLPLRWLRPKTAPAPPLRLLPPKRIRLGVKPENRLQPFWRTGRRWEWDGWI